MRRKKEDQRIGRCAALVLRMVAELESAGLRRNQAIEAVERALLEMVNREARSARQLFKWKVQKTGEIRRVQ